MPVFIHDSFAELPTADWDALTVGSTIYSSSGFAGVREEELPPGARCRYLLARDAAGEVVAGMESYTFLRPPHGLFTPADLLEGVIGAERLAHLAASPLSIAAGWSEFRGQVPGRPGVPAEQRAAAVGDLTAQAMRLADAADASVLAYYYLPLEEAQEVARAHAGDGAVLLFHDVETVVPIGLWNDFDEYVAWLPSGRRPRARRELRRFLASGRTVRESPLPQVVKEIAPLNSALMLKHGHTAFDEERVTSVYDRQGRFLGDSSTVLISEDDGKAVGFALRYRQGDMLYGRVAGFDYSAPNLADYFNLVFYHPIAAGVGRDVRAIHLGLGTFEAKMVRGAQPNPLYSVFVGVDRPLDADADAVREYNRSRTAAFVDEHAGFVVGGIDADSWLPA
ncbi:GNAT family N-acetyltransferase [Streptomyces sp. SL13]|uniref:GNAT family N-acetyltransferase n=1 Tax=Streptantibioticus silvisoli TaxID=2705255 RepID=A0AA90HEQ2_9ACTN|nr:GNAT family N-acetyltransferase [Streptantibioticus silvisoli]MDI5966018.1 GNAT family N-acetyltransferase [Streptantibioticus silvisoli]MDI5973582.1 GNAT family N-acetyltransferase [Streptantibioticus silvisoli]